MAASIRKVTGSVGSDRVLGIESRFMRNVMPSLLAFVTSSFRTRLSMQAEILALRHQLAVYRNSKK